MENSNSDNTQKEVYVSSTESLNSERFSQFINAYAVSWAANHFLTVMNSEQRIAFFTVITQTYPDEWKEAIKKLP